MFNLNEWNKMIKILCEKNSTCHSCVPAGKSLYVTRMFQNFRRTFPTATYLTVRLIEPKVNFDCLVQTLCEKQASLKEQDPVLLHIDTAAVCSTTLHCYSLQSLLIGVILLL